MPATPTTSMMTTWMLLFLWICTHSIDSASAAHSFRGAAAGHRRSLPQPQQYDGAATPPPRERRVMEDKEEEDDDENDDDEEEEDEENIMAPPPTAAPIFVATTAAPTLPPTFAVTTATENDGTGTTAPVIDNNDINNNDDPDDTEPATTAHSLLPFMVEVQGWDLLDSTKEVVFRFHLEQYLLQSLQDGEVSTILDSIRLDRPWTVTTPDGRRRLQEDESIASTTTTTGNATTNLLLQYQGQAILKEAAGFWDDQPTEDLIHESQVNALQNSVALQDYFIDLFLTNKTEQAVIFLELQVEDSSVTWDPDATWDKIAAMNETQQDGQQQQDQQEENNPATGNDSSSSQVSSDGISTTTIILIVCAVVLVVIACLAVACLLRIKKRRHSSRLSKLPGAPDVHAMELASDVDSEMDDIVYDKSLLRSEKNNSPTMTRTSSWDDDEENSSGKGSSGTGRISLARVSALFRKSKSNTPSDEMEILDDVVGLPPVSRTGSNATSTSHSFKQNESSEGIEIFPHDSSNSRTSSPVIDLTTPGRNAAGIQFSQKEAPRPGSRTMVHSPRQKKATQEEHDELDSVMANMNLYSMTSFDEESMMGYSLASADTGYKHNISSNDNLQQLNVSQESEITLFTDDGDSPQDRSQEIPAPDSLARQPSDGDSSNGSEPSNKNSMLPGVRNLLNSSKGPKASSKSKKWYRAGKKNRPLGFISSDSESVGSLEHVLEEASAKSDSSASSVFIEDDNESVEVGLADEGHNLAVEDETASSYKEANSDTGDSSSVASDADALSDVDGAGGLSALGYYNEGGKGTPQLNMLPQITPVPSEEMDEMILQTPIVNNAGFGSMRTAPIPDNVSDAPSDERSINVATLAMQSSLMDPRERIQIQNVTSVDNDPAVVGYLMKERNSMKQRMRRKRADRKQSPVTMEV